MRCWGFGSSHVQLEASLNVRCFLIGPCYDRLGFPWSSYRSSSLRNAKPFLRNGVLRKMEAPPLTSLISVTKFVGIGLKNVKTRSPRNSLRSFSKTRKATWIRLKISRTTSIDSGHPIWQPSRVDALKQDWRGTATSVVLSIVVFTW